jgi:L-alanine-DL-glutamate epimerase-like enolase superfamily enzyme
MSAAVVASLPNVRIMEIDIDDVPWKDELVSKPPEIVNGYMKIPDGPGWGMTVNEEAVRAHPWKPGQAHGRNVAAR